MWSLTSLSNPFPTATLSSLEQLPEDHPVLHFLDKIPTLITNSINPNEVALAIAQKIFKRMYEKIEYDLQIDTHIAILEHIRDVCKKIVKELTNWIIYSDADVRYSCYSVFCLPT